MRDNDVVVDGDQPRHGHHRKAETCTDQNQNHQKFKTALILGMRPAAVSMYGKVLHSTISVCTNHIARECHTTRYGAD